MVDVDNFVESMEEREGRDCLKIVKTTRRLGAAGNVASMVAALGGFDAPLYGSASTRQIVDIKRIAPGFCHVLGHEGQTTVRERFQTLDGKSIGPRLDRGSRLNLGVEDQHRLAVQAASGASAVIVCDHHHGVVGPELMKTLKEIGVPVFVDPHPESDFRIFGGVECLCANRNEALGVADVDPDPANLCQKMDKDGVWWYRKGWREAPIPPKDFFDPYRLHFPTICLEPVDTLGAGDQFIATLTVWRLEEQSWESSIMAANIAAGIQCERRGIVPVTREDIKARLPY
jgi:bifunctional ADP-heptose synthase (sugar kinase/adenylyltransferase)